MSWMELKFQHNDFFFCQNFNHCNSPNLASIYSIIYSSFVWVPSSFFPNAVKPHIFAIVQQLWIASEVRGPWECNNMITCTLTAPWEMSCLMHVGVHCDIDFFLFQQRLSSIYCKTGFCINFVDASGAQLLWHYAQAKIRYLTKFSLCLAEHIW